MPKSRDFHRKHKESNKVTKSNDKVTKSNDGLQPTRHPYKPRDIFTSQTKLGQKKVFTMETFDQTGSVGNKGR